jgi:hypothetical protein
MQERIHNPFTSPTFTFSLLLFFSFSDLVFFFHSLVSPGVEVVGQGDPISNYWIETENQ